MAQEAVDIEIIDLVFEPDAEVVDRNVDVARGREDDPGVEGLAGLGLQHQLPLRLARMLVPIGAIGNIDIRLLGAAEEIVIRRRIGVARAGEDIMEIQRGSPCHRRRAAAASWKRRSSTPALSVNYHAVAGKGEAVVPAAPDISRNLVTGTRFSAPAPSCACPSRRCP